MRLLPGITTTHSRIDGALCQLSQALSLGVRECALFLTCLTSRERIRFYKECMSRFRDISFPFVHARSDMSPEEFNLLMERFGTKRFNLHATRILPITHDLGVEIRRHIFIENTPGLVKPDLRGFAGVCLDVSHMEDLRRLCPDVFGQTSRVVDLAGVGANHISAIASTPVTNESGALQYSRHSSRSFEEFAYLAAYPHSWFSDFCAIELENPIDEQLQIISQIERMLGDPGEGSLAA